MPSSTQQPASPGARKLRIGLLLLAVAVVGGIVFFAVLARRLMPSLEAVAEVDAAAGVAQEFVVQEPGPVTFWFEGDIGSVEASDVAVTGPPDGEALIVEPSPIAGLSFELGGVGETGEFVAQLRAVVREPGVHSIEIGGGVEGTVAIAPSMPFGELVVLVLGGLVTGALFLVALVLVVVGAAERRRSERPGSVPASRTEPASNLSRTAPLTGSRANGFGPPVPPPPPKGATGLPQPPIGASTRASGGGLGGSAMHPPPPSERGARAQDASSADSDRNRSESPAPKSGWSQPSRPPRLPPDFGDSRQAASPGEQH